VGPRAGLDVCKNSRPNWDSLCVQNIAQKNFKVNKKLYIDFVDLLKTFLNVNRKVIMKILKMIKILVDYRDRRIIRVIQTSNDIYKNKRK
jgi:hypothetical protein